MTDPWEHYKPVHRPDKAASSVVNRAYVRRALRHRGMAAAIDAEVTDALRKEGCICGYLRTARLVQKGV